MRKNNNINITTIKIIYSKLLNLFTDFNLPLNLININRDIFMVIDNFFTYKNHENYDSNSYINDLTNIIKNYIKVNILINDIFILNEYKNQDLKYFISYFYESIDEYLNKDDLYIRFIDNLNSYITLQDNNTNILDTQIINNITYNLSDIKDLLYNSLYTNDIDKLTYIYACGNKCNCTEEMICNNKNKILEILNNNIIYKPYRILYRNINNIQYDYSDPLLTDDTIYNIINNYLNNNWDLSMNIKYPQLYVPNI